MGDYVMGGTLTISTLEKIEVINVSVQLRTMVSNVQEGIALFYTPHTTAALIICEDDEALRADLVKVAQQWLSGVRPFAHIRNNNPNTEAHVLSAFAGTSVTVAIRQGHFDLGTYQNVLFLEMDGPKNREIRCQIIGT